jgi:hypothetical protein|tara:strand:+ start:3033 stop:3389 length:357 start_codon:yes stop_codon:yes gene_type:complete
MANTFKTVTAAGITSEEQIYVAGGSVVATILLGVMVANTTTSQVTVSVKLVSDTASRTHSGTNSGANNTVHLIKNAPVPVGSSLELLAGNKIVLEDTDEITLTASGASDITISIMEIT